MEKNSENPNELWTARAAVLAAEIEFLEQVRLLQNLLRDALINRQWADYERLTASMSGLGAAFLKLEERRTELFGDAGWRRFYDEAARLPPGKRDRLTALYRRLKMQTLEIRLANESLAEYIKESRAAVNRILENAYPDRKGKIYSSAGTERETEMKSVLLNHTF
jgi:hypothetical protein